MCGIAGFIGKGTKDDARRMTRAICYRGPDAQAVWQEGNVALAHARLAIIDLTPSGAQPMHNSAKSATIVFNGEIYNYRELKNELVAAGYRFTGTSDTEVILALYDREGERCFARLDGMFAVALYDSVKHTLTLARDRMGKKPLYWGLFGDTFLFASEPKALMVHPAFRKELDLAALDMYLANDYVPTPFAIWKGVRKLEPGTFLVYEQGKMRSEKFWDPPWDECALSEPEALKELDRLLAHAVEERLVADVPLGVFLSGGLDSSTVAWYAARARKTAGQKIDTFAIGFSEASFDESAYARTVAEHIGAQHHERILSGKDALDIIPEVLGKLDEPMADASIIPTALLSRFARGSVTVALGGDGGDELFAGYPTFQAELFRSPFTVMLARTAVPLLPVSSKNFGPRFKLEKFLDGAEESDMARRHMRWLGTFGPELRASLLSADVREALEKEKSDAYAFARDRFLESGASDERNKLLFAYQRTYMMDDVMVKVDRASMYASLETRAPFLAREVVEFANRLSYDLKLRGMTTKFLLKHLMRDRLPDGIADRPKKGFGIPVADWLRRPLRDWAEELLSASVLNKYGMFEMDVVGRLKDDHMENRRDNRKILWNLLSYATWQMNYFAD